MTGTSQATAVVSGLAALMLDLCARHAVDLGPQPGKTLKQIIRHAARALRIGDRNDFGGGALVWPVLVNTLKDFATDNDFRRQALQGPELKLLD
jgi:hypothetical protein